MQTKQQQLSPTSKNVDDSHNKNYPLIEREPVTGTPFTLVGHEGKYFIVMGDYRLTEPTTTKEETLKKLRTEKYNIILAIATIVYEKMKETEPKRHTEGGSKQTL